MTIQDFQDRLCGYRPTLQQARAEFAVLVPLIERPDGLHLLYEVRAQNLRHHAAEVCFPGGRMEPSETPVQCALRETWEELAIAPEDVTVLGELDFLYLRSECLMHPVLARADAAALGHMSRSPAEVRDTFLVPTGCAPIRRRYTATGLTPSGSRASPMTRRASRRTTAGSARRWRCPSTAVCRTRSGG